LSCKTIDECGVNLSLFLWRKHYSNIIHIRKNPKKRSTPPTCALLSSKHIFGEKGLTHGRNMSRWWVYENRLHDRAIVHHYQCPFCNDGKGVHESSGKYDRWHGSHPSAKEALEFAESLGRRETKIGGCCIKYAKNKKA
jgi:hypothetical protein